MSILIVSDEHDAHANAVEKRLLAKGAAVIRFSPSELPAAATLSARVSNEGYPGVSVKLRRGGEDVPLDGVHALWLRRCPSARADARLSPTDRSFAAGETTSFLYSLAAALDGRHLFSVNPIGAAVGADGGNGKVSQLELARRYDLAIPKTLVTNDPADAREFVRSCPGGAIYKPIHSPIEKGRAVFTTKLKGDETLDAVRLAPCIFQELVPKRVEIRAVVMGSRVFATEIHSQTDERSSVDFRAHYALGKTPYFAHELPREIQEKLVALQVDLGLRFGVHDLILTPEGRYVFLEVNQQGNWLWLEQQTRQPLLENFCEFLMQASHIFALAPA